MMPEMRPLTNAKPDTTSSLTRPQKSSSASMTSLSERKIDTPLLRSRRKNSATPLSKLKETFGTHSQNSPEPTSTTSSQVNLMASTPTSMHGRLPSTRDSRTSRTFQFVSVTDTNTVNEWLYHHPYQISIRCEYIALSCFSLKILSKFLTLHSRANHHTSR